MVESSGIFSAHPSGEGRELHHYDEVAGRLCKILLPSLIQTLQRGPTIGISSELFGAPIPPFP